MRQIARPRGVLAVLVYLEMVSLLNVVTHGTENLPVRMPLIVYGDNPLQAVSAGASEQKKGLEVLVIE